MKNSLQKTIEAINNVIYDPAHAIPDEGAGTKNKLYTEETYWALVNKVSVMARKYHLGLEDIPDNIKLIIINDIVKTNVKVRHSYFDAFEERIPVISEDELPYRTAYGALVKGEAMCAGYAEACRIFCELSGIKSHTILSKLPGKNKHLLHYVTLATTADGESFILDPEREASCDKKGYDFDEYQKSMDFLTPTNLFFEQKVGDNGVGPDVAIYMQDSIKQENGSALFLIDNNNVAHLQTASAVENDEQNNPNEPSEQIKIHSTAGKPIDKLMENPKFRDYLRNHRAVFMVHGVENVGALSKIMDIAKSKNTTKQSEPGE